MLDLTLARELPNRFRFGGSLNQALFNNPLDFVTKRLCPDSLISHGERILVYTLAVVIGLGMATSVGLLFMQQQYVAAVGCAVAGILGAWVMPYYVDRIAAALQENTGIWFMVGRRGLVIMQRETQGTSQEARENIYFIDWDNFTGTIQEMKRGEKRYLALRLNGDFRPRTIAGNEMAAKEIRRHQHVMVDGNILIPGETSDLSSLMSILKDRISAAKGRFERLDN